MDSSDFLDMFLDEAVEQLETINSMLLVLEKNPEDNESLAELFRMAHSLKGAAASMGFNNIASLTHETETLLDIFRSGAAKISGDSTETLYRSFETLEALVCRVEQSGDDEESIDLMLGELRGCIGGLKAAAAPPPPHEKKKKQPQRITKKNEAAVPGRGDISPSLLQNLTLEIGAAVEVERKKGRSVYEIVVVVEEKEEMSGLRALVVLGRMKEHGSVLDYYPDVENDIVDDCRYFHFLVATDRSEEFMRAAIGGAGIERMIFSSAEEAREDGVHLSGDARARVLVIDDSRYFRNKISALLKGNGFEAAEAEDAIEGLYACKKERFDIVLLDINMPYMQGLEAISFLLKIDHDMKIIMMSSIDDERMILRAIKSGARDYIVKPFDPVSALLTIERIRGRDNAAVEKAAV